MKSFLETNEELNEGLITSTFSTATAMIIIKKLVTPIKKWKMYELGMVDEKGKPTDKIPTTPEEKESVNIFNTFIMQLKRIFLFFMSEGMLKILITVYVVKNLVKK